MVAAAGEAGAGRSGSLANNLANNLEWTATEREERIVLRLGFEASELPGLSELPARVESGHPAGLSELALEAALSDLGAVLRCPAPGSLELILRNDNEVIWP